MARNSTSSTTIPDPAQSPFDAFVGFVYATTIALVIGTAYFKSRFETIVPVTLTLLLLGFFAYDWTARCMGRQQMKGAINQSSTLFLLKLLLELAIIYFLLLVSLKLVENFENLDFDSLLRLWRLPPGEPLCYSMAAFVIFSGAWNYVMIGISKQAEWKQVLCVLSGHLDEDIVKQFPRIQVWLTQVGTKKARIRDEIDKEVDKRHSLQPDEPEKQGGRGPDADAAFLKTMNHLRRELGFWLTVKSLLRTPHHLLLPYLFVFHVVALHFALGIFIVASRFYFDARSVTDAINYHPLISYGIVSTGAILSLLFLVQHFVTNRTSLVSERLGCACLVMTILFIYSRCSARGLIVLVVFQQIVANIIMTRYYRPAHDKPINAKV